LDIIIYFFISHCSILTDSQNQDWIFYHAKNATDKSTEDPPRMLYMDRIYYDENQWPTTDKTAPTITPQNGPVFLD